MIRRVMFWLVLFLPSWCSSWISSHLCSSLVSCDCCSFFQKKIGNKSVSNLCTNAFNLTYLFVCVRVHACACAACVPISFRFLNCCWQRKEARGLKKKTFPRQQYRVWYTAHIKIIFIILYLYHGPSSRNYHLNSIAVIQYTLWIFFIS